MSIEQTEPLNADQARVLVNRGRAAILKATEAMAELRDTWTRFDRRIVAAALDELIPAEGGAR